MANHEFRYMESLWPKIRSTVPPLNLEEVLQSYVSMKQSSTPPPQIKRGVERDLKKIIRVLRMAIRVVGPTPTFSGFIDFLRNISNKEDRDILADEAGSALTDMLWEKPSPLRRCLCRAGVTYVYRLMKKLTKEIGREPEPFSSHKGDLLQQEIDVDLYVRHWLRYVMLSS